MFGIFSQVFREFLCFRGKTLSILLLVGLFIATAILAIEPLFMARVITYIEDFYHTGEFSFSSFLLFLGLWGIYIIISVITSYIHRYFIADKSSLEFHNFIALKYSQQVYHMSMGAYLSKKTGSIYKNFDRGAGAHFEIAFFLLKDGIKTVFSLVFVLIFLLITSWQMTLLALAMVPCMAFLGILIYKKTIGPQQENTERWTRAFGHMGDFLGNMQLGKILLLEPLFLRKFYTELNEALDKQKYTSRWWSLSDMVISVFVMISRFLVLGYGVYAISQGILSLADLMLVFSLIGMIYYPLGYLFGSVSNLQKYATTLETFYDEFARVETDTESDAPPISITKGHIVFDHVRFGYTPERTILQDFSLEIQPGESIALVGNTGAGKSTVLSILLRFWDTTSGTIQIDGQDITKYTRASLRSHFGLVAQDSSLFNVSIRENLLFAKPDATEAEIRHALKEASAEFVFSLENGLDTIIGERGLKLS